MKFVFIIVEDEICDKIEIVMNILIKFSLKFIDFNLYFEDLFIDNDFLDVVLF